MTDEKNIDPTVDLDEGRSEVLERALEDKAIADLLEKEGPPKSPDEVVIEDIQYEILAQYEKGYDAAHDHAAGPYHLLAEMTERLTLIHQQGYLSIEDREKLVKIAAVNVALIKVLDRIYGRPE